MKQHTISLLDLLNNYCRRDQLDFNNQLRCDKCSQLSQAYKKINFWILPNYLIITLKRFDNNGRKINEPIQYPLKGLDLAAFVTRPSSEAIRSVYDLYAVALHRGYSVNSGHYYAFCELPNKTWAEFNDETTTPIDELDDLIQPNHAYMLFYRLR